MEICLVNPPSSFLLDERVFPSLGLLKVAASLERVGHRVSVLDLSGIENYMEVIEEYVGRFRPDAYGLSTTTPQLPTVARIARALRAAQPDVRLIIGGPHITLASAAAKYERRLGRQGRGSAALASVQMLCDVLVAGDGDLAVHEALTIDLPALIDADERGSRYFMSDEVYDHTPLPARHLIDLPSYRYTIDGMPATSLIAQLGCPFSCGFCGGRNSRSLRVPRQRSIDSIVHELELLYRTYGYTGFMFYDDEMNVNRKQFIELLEAITRLQNRLKVEFRLRGFVKSELFDARQAEAMVEAGFRWLLCGFEAAAPTVLKSIGKRATIDDNTRAVEAAQKAGLKVKALMSCGHPGESEETIVAIRDWLVARRVEDFDCTSIVPYPGTPYYDEAVLNPERPGVWTYTAPTGDRLHALEVDYVADAQYYKGDPDGGYKSFVFTDHLSPEDIVRLRDWVERDVRHVLGIPFNVSRVAQRFEHSMGQGLPDFILRSASPSAMFQTAGHAL
ncbi:MAG: B12-binding domain-containing radical SAM protein [Alphaproteobacteria bacterium]